MNLTESTIQQDAEAAVLFITERLNLDISFGPFVQTAAPNTSASAGQYNILLWHACCNSAFPTIAMQVECFPSTMI